MRGDRTSAGFRLLLITTDPCWEMAVRAAFPYAPVPVCVGSLGAALARLVVVPQPFTHVLLQSDLADDVRAFTTLRDLTVADASGATALLALGRPIDAAPQLPRAVAASRTALLDAFAVLPDRTATQPPVSLGDLRTALAGVGIHARYQPVVRLDDRRPILVEALARLDHPEQGVLLPDSFVPVVEDAGLAAALTERMAACALADLFVATPKRIIVPVALNLPLELLLIPAALDRLDEQRETAGVAAADIMIELTESQPVDDLHSLARAVERLRGQGYQLAIDDAGPQMAHHDALVGMPFTTLKLDQEIVRLGGHEADARRFAEQITQRAHASGMTVIAEGVEDAGTWARLKQAGADLAQGFLIARPLPPAALPVWLAAWEERRAAVYAAAHTSR